MASFEKLVFLPSGGFLYSPFVRIKPLSSDFLMFQSDQDMYDSLFDYQLAIIRRCCTFDFDIMKMSTQDFFYIWTYILMTDIQQESGMFLTYKCDCCNHENKIFLDASKMNVTVANKFEKKIEKQCSWKKNNLSITFRIRTIEDNIVFSNLLLNSETENQDWYFWILYIVSQIDELFLNGIKIEPENYISVLQYNVHYPDVIELYTVVHDHDFQFGIDNKVYFFCQECKQPQKTVLYDNILCSVMNHGEVSKQAFEVQKNALEEAMYFSRFKIFSYEEYMNSIPMRYADLIKKVVGKMEFVPMI